MSHTHSERPQTLGDLRKSAYPEERFWEACLSRTNCAQNLICKLQRGEELFPGIVGYEDTVVPQVVNAILSRHNFILLGLRGQAKTRLIRMLTTLLDPWMPYVAGLRDSRQPVPPDLPPLREMLIAEQGDDTPIAWLTADDRYVEKLATPDVTIADMIGDIDPIKAARARPGYFGRTDRPLRPGAARQSRHLRHQRTARPRGQDPGRPVQHHAGRRRAD